MPASLVASLFLISHYFLLLGSLLQKPPADFPFLEVLKGWFFVLSFSKVSRFHFFQTHLLAAFPFVIFPRWADSFSIRPKDRKSPPFLVLHGFPEVPRLLFISYWFLGLLTSFLHHWVANKDTSVLVPCVSRHPRWTVLIHPGFAACPRIPGSWKSSGISAQFFPWAPQRFLSLVGWAFFFPLSHEIWNLPIHRFGFFLMILNGFRLLPHFLYWRPKYFTFFFFSIVQSFLMFWALVQYYDLLDLNRTKETL